MLHVFLGENLAQSVESVTRQHAVYM